MFTGFRTENHFLKEFTRMKKILSVILAIALMICCASVMAEQSPIKVAVVYSDTVDDKGWCQAMHEGILKVQAAGANIEYTPVESVAVPNASATLDQLAGEYDIIIIHGAQFTTATTEIAEEYPEQVFVLGTSDKILGDNIFTYMPQSEETGYVNGVIAAMLTKVGKVGVVGSQDNGDSARFVRGFYMGVKSVNADTECMVSWTGSFSDTIGAGDITKTFIESGCDILTGSSQQAVGGIRAAEAAGNVTWIGQTLSQLNDFPAVVVAAGDYDYAAVLVSVINEMANGVTGGKCIPMNFNNNGFVYEFSENVPAEVKTAAEEALAKLNAEADTLASYIDVQF